MSSSRRNPKEPRRHWRILSPIEVGAVACAFEQLAAEAVEEEQRAWLEQARVVFMTILGADQIGERIFAAVGHRSGQT